MKLKNLDLFIFFGFMVVGINPVQSQLKLADIFSDNLVLQREEPITIWGTASPESIIEILFLNTRQIAKTNLNGEWEVVFDKQEGNLTSQELKVKTSKDSITLKNILIGDIWVLLGQSNMKWPMSSEMHYKEEIGMACNNLLRFYNPNINQLNNEVQRQKLAKGELFSKKNWEVSDTLSFSAMSAVGYYFGKKITTSTNIPVGLINLSIGGAPLETFIARETLSNNLKFKDKIHGNWLFNNHLPVWIRERGSENTDGHFIKYPKSGPNHAFKPGFAFSSGIAPILKMPIKGILLYQGESNAQEMERVEEYPDLKKLMVEDLRRSWQRPDLPFFWVQLSSIDTLNYNSGLWPNFRDEQRRSLEKINNSGMAVSSDIGHKNNVHPSNKKDVGKRLARWALNRVYGLEIVVSGPLPKKAEYLDGAIFIDFEYTVAGLKTVDGSSLKGFSINKGKDKIDAVIINNQVVIKTASKPDYIYYGWQPFSTGNLTNSESLPASTFKIKVD
jgi:sialate O-acetylesterase